MILVTGSTLLRYLRLSNGTTYYKLESTTGRGVLLEFDIAADGRRIDYLALDRFWGAAPRPLFWHE